MRTYTYIGPEGLHYPTLPRPLVDDEEGEHLGLIPEPGQEYQLPANPGDGRWTPEDEPPDPTPPAVGTPDAASPREPAGGAAQDAQGAPEPAPAPSAPAKSARTR